MPYKTPMHAPTEQDIPVFVFTNCGSNRRCNLQHGLQVIGNLEGGLGLGLDLLDGDAVGNLNQSEAVGEVHVEDIEISDDAADTGRAGQRELALLDNLGVTLLVSVFHGHNDLGGGRVGNEVHGTTEALDFTGKHP